ncbi:MAG: hypothetical protein J6J36_05885 [Clostridia bacterium]|nr:hypothetical protein [Clostridia bacterium]
MGKSKKPKYTNGSADERKSYQLKNMAEIDFIRSIYDRNKRLFYFNKKTQSLKPIEDVLEQIDAIKNIIQYVKQRKEKGLTLNQINDELYNFMETFMSSIAYPDLIGFYMLRTSEYINGMDLTPYFEQIVAQNINMHEYARKNRENYSANLDENILVEVCIMLSELAKGSMHPKEGEFADLCGKIESNNLTMSDIPLMKKYFDLAYKELKIGRSNAWKKLKTNSEALRRRFIKNIPNMFEFESVTFGDEKDEASQIIEESGNVEKQAVGFKNVKDTPMPSILDNQRKEAIPSQLDISAIAEAKKVITTSSVLGRVNKLSHTEKIAIFKPKYKSLFIGNNDDNNFILFIYELFNLLTEGQSPEEKKHLINELYKMFMVSENEQNKDRREHFREKTYTLFEFFNFEHKPLDITQSMLIRLAKIMDFFESKGELNKYCKTNNYRLKRIKLDKLQIEPEEVFSKFIQTDDRKPFYFIEKQPDEEQYYSSIVSQTPISRASEEAIIGMSGFYTNRLAKETAKYSRILYICAQQDIIAKAFYNPNFEYEDLGYTPEDIALMMSVCDEMRLRMKRQYYDKVNPETFLYEEREIEELTPMFANIKNAYNNYFSDRGFNFDFDRDLFYMIKDVKVTEKAYKLKEFSVKSLIYTAMTDKNKNIINWGYVTIDDKEDDSKVLIGFDIKGLNMPVYYHMDKEDLIKFIKELTNGNCEIPVYIGADDMYSYVLGQRLTTQILYPMSKDEKNKGLLKVDGYMVADHTYMHMRWLQQPNNPPYKNRSAGDEMYNVETGEIRKVAIAKNNQQKNKPKKSNGKSSKNKSGHSSR